jgi:hypothetical protein
MKGKKNTCSLAEIVAEMVVTSFCLQKSLGKTETGRRGVVRVDY